MLAASTREEDEDLGGDSCQVNEQNALTSNETLKQWLPKLENISDLLKTTEATKIQPRTDKCPALIRVTYQTPTEVTWKAEKSMLTGRTLEEAFGLENLEWCQNSARKHLGLKVVSKSVIPPLAELHSKLFKRVDGKSFKKTDFALSLMMEEPDKWVVPKYITEGLKWLSEQLTPSQSRQEIAGAKND